MFSDITKEDVLQALKEGNASCNLKGDAESFDPNTLYNSIVNNLDEIFSNQIDITREREFNAYLNRR